MNLNENLYRTRRLKNAFAMVLSSGAALIGLGWLVWILLTTLIKGGSALSLDLFTEMTPPPTPVSSGVFTVGGEAAAAAAVAAAAADLDTPTTGALPMACLPKLVALEVDVNMRGVASFGRTRRSPYRLLVFLI